MKNSILLISFSLFSMLSMAQVIERTVTSSSGGELKGNSSIIDFVVGETMISKYTSKAGTVSEGFLQGYTISEIPLGNNEFESILIKVYPNPTTDKLFVQADNETGYNYQVINSNGVTLVGGNSKLDTQEIDFTSYASGVYYLSISSEKGEIKKFKIIKNK